MNLIRPASRTTLAVLLVGVLSPLSFESSATASVKTPESLRWPVAGDSSALVATAQSHLAVGTDAGMDIWSATSEAQPVGPRSGVQVEIYDINWSSNGRYLAWIQAPHSANSTSPQLVEYDLTTKRYEVWTSNNPFSGLVPGPEGIVASDLSGTDLRQFKVNFASPKVIKLPVSAFTTLSAYGAGFLANEFSFPSSGPTGKASPIARVSVAGVVSSTRVALPAIPNVSSPGFEITTASANGDLEGAELGDHTDICGVGPSSVIYIANTLTGRVTWQGPPAPRAKGSVLRVQSLAFSPGGVLDATMLNCDATFGAGLSTSLWENTGRGWHQIGSGVLSAARGPGGVLATVSGYLAFQHSASFPTPIPAGAQRLYIGGKWIPLGARAHEIAWSP